MSKQAQPTPDLLVVLGPTASGKTALAVCLAEQMQSVILSADSRQVYRGMDIGTGKDLEEYGNTPVHLLDIVDPQDDYNVFAYQRDFVSLYSSFTAQGVIPILAGGSGLYLEAVIRGYQFAEVPENPALRAELAALSDAELAQKLKSIAVELHNSTDLTQRNRLMRAIEIANYQQSHTVPKTQWPIQNPLLLGVRWPRDILRKRITIRLKQRLNGGMIEEVEHLLAQGVSHQRLDYFGLEYRFISAYLQGNMRYNDFYQRLNSAIHQFAKRQDTWFRKMERSGLTIHWVAGGEQACAQALEIVKNTGIMLPAQKF